MSLPAHPKGPLTSSDSTPCSEGNTAPTAQTTQVSADDMTRPIRLDQLRKPSRSSFSISSSSLQEKSFRQGRVFHLRAHARSQYGDSTLSKFGPAQTNDDGPHPDDITLATRGAPQQTDQDGDQLSAHLSKMPLSRSALFSTSELKPVAKDNELSSFADKATLHKSDSNISSKLIWKKNRASSSTVEGKGKKQPNAAILSSSKKVPPAKPATVAKPPSRGAVITLLDKVIPITESMFDDPSKYDPLVFSFDKEETPENVIYMSASDKETVDYNKEFPAVKAAVLEKLILGLTPEGYSDPDFIFTFLINMPSFTTPSRVLSLLKLRWNIPFPDHPPLSADGKTPIDFETFQKKKLFPIRLRIFNVLKLWLEDHQKLVDEETKSLIKEFVSETMSKDLPGPAALLMRVIQAMGEHNDENVMFNHDPPKPLIPTQLKQPLTLLNIHPEELVRQITLLDSNYFRKINLHEFLNNGWMKPDKERRSPNILIMINSFNNISRWVSSEILRQTSLKQRALTINFFICMAQKFYEYHNYNGIMEILSALQNSAIHRLYDTWDMLPLKSWEMFNNLCTLMNSNAGEGNYYCYRMELEGCIPPVIPYLGVHLTDLIFLNDGNKDFIDEEKKMINWYKMSKIARVVRSMAIKQQAPYCLSIVYPIIRYVIEAKLLSDEEQYEQSLKLEKKVPKSQRGQTMKTMKKIKVDFRAYNIDT
ncbi:ras guanine nucleotide exchange factor A-like [Schistocerca gregaria]|uniref:ras guanine nucleotide exchange factor A-like n=1 Tax=Schistocerca gregaria TaxID=7010 RepID=UPI00211EBDC5|nr:ras guanine nucleotide exchange factor A-like [Schistocerca gregaria]XP_049849438.1 ras guanine nucleotide exchange factor A-like [Schistocerca gregaria]XP_049849439.1 ras guanine nucleotide exchange factor A-like [Schistocerca gregaria]